MTDYFEGAIGRKWKTPGDLAGRFPLGAEDGGGWKVWLRDQLSQTVHCHDAIVASRVAWLEQKSKTKKICKTKYGPFVVRSPPVLSH